MSCDVLSDVIGVIAGVIGGVMLAQAIWWISRE